MEPFERLLQARTAKGLSQAKLGELAGTSGQQIEKLEKDQRKLTLEWAERLAPHLGCTAKDILFGTAPQPVDKPSPMYIDSPLRLVGFIEAGAWRDVDSHDFLEQEIMVPRDGRFPMARQYCLTVRGDSMNAAKPIPILEGAVLRCVSLIDTAMSLKDGQIVVVERTRDGGHLIEATVKRVAILPNHIELRPESTNARHQPIIWDEQSERSGETRVTGLVTAIINELAPL